MQYVSQGVTSRKMEVEVKIKILQKCHARTGNHEDEKKYNSTYSTLRRVLPAVKWKFESES